MSARDRDDPPYNRIEYSLRDDLGGTFRINSTTGEIFAERPLDREMKAQYELEVFTLSQQTLIIGQPRAYRVTQIKPRLAGLVNLLSCFLYEIMTAQQPIIMEQILRR